VYASSSAPRRARVVALLVAGVVVVGGAAAYALGTRGGSSKPHPSSSTATNTRHTVTHAHKAVHPPAPKAPAVPPAETSVAVLNATEAEGLAHRTASALQQNGYSQATALSGRPPGSGQVSVVEYASGHQAEAEGVARSLSITHVLPIEAGVTALASSASVVVIVAADRVGQNP
jgi:LytR cell envelope-related transcriptional attenuator